MMNPMANGDPTPSRTPASRHPASGELRQTIAEAMRAAHARDAALHRKKRSARAVPVRLLAPLSWLIALVQKGAGFLPRLSAGGSARGRDLVAGWLAALERRLPPAYVLRPGFRWGAAILSANATAFGLTAWSDHQALRFPKAEGEAAPQVFPVFGECAGNEYMILLSHAVLLAAAAAYLGAWWLDARADD